MLAATIFVIVAGFYAYLAALDDRISPEQAHIVAAALKEHQPQRLYPHDPVFGPGNLWQVFTPVFQSAVKMVLVPTGYDQPVLPFRVMVPVLTLLYLGAMYSLLYRQCRSWSVAVLVAVVSTRVVHGLGRSQWGVGSLGSASAATMYLAVLPLLVMTMLRQLETEAETGRPARLMVLFALIGLGGNLDLVMALNVTLVLLVTYLGVRRFAPSAWPRALAYLGCAALGAAPYTLYYILLRVQMASASTHVDPAAIERAFRIAELAVLYPDVLKSALNWFALTGLFAIAAAIVLSRLEHMKTRNLAFWVWFAVGGVFVATVLHASSQALGTVMGSPPPVIDFIQAGTLILLPIFVFLAQGITNLSRLLRHRRAFRWILAGLAVAWLAPSDNLRVARYFTQEVASVSLPMKDKPDAVQRHRRRRQEKADLKAIGLWARVATDTGAVFLTDQYEFRLLARRSIVANRFDARTLYYLAPWRLDEMMARLEHQDRLLDPPAGPHLEPACLDFLKDLVKQDDFQGTTEWYVILRAKFITDDVPQLRRIEPEEDKPAWGKQYRVYRVEMKGE